VSVEDTKVALKKANESLARAKAWAEHCREGLSRVGRAKRLWRKRALDALEASGAYYALAQRLEKTCCRQKAVIANLLVQLARAKGTKVGREPSPTEAMAKEDLRPCKGLKEVNVLLGWKKRQGD
jgi:hypothetical protein